MFNMVFYILLPATFFGIYYKIKQRDFRSIESTMFLVILGNMLSVSLVLRSCRYTIPIFPLLLLFFCYGLMIKKLWKKYIPI